MVAVLNFEHHCLTVASYFYKYGLGDSYCLSISTEIWDALRAAATEADLTLAQTIVDSAGIIVSNPDLTVCYDERGEHIFASCTAIVQVFISLESALIQSKLRCRCQVRTA